MARPYLRVPKAQAAALVRLVTLEQERHDALSRALRESKPTTSIPALADQIAESARFDRKDAYDLLHLLAMLYTIRERERATPGDFLLEIERATKDVVEDRADIDWQDARTRLGELLSHNSSLGVTAKAVDVLNEHDRMFCDARVLTDVRPVFGSNVGQSPEVFILVHELRVSYHEGPDLKAVYITLDSEDVRTLRAALDRAAEKEASLDKVLSVGPVPVLKAKSHDCW